MSANLVYEPVRPTKYTCLSTNLKFILSKKFGLDNGPDNLGTEDIPYLQGVLDCSNSEDAKDMQKLIDTIEKFGQVRMWLNY